MHGRCGGRFILIFLLQPIRNDIITHYNKVPYRMLFYIAIRTPKFVCTTYVFIHTVGGVMLLLIIINLYIQYRFVLYRPLSDPSSRPAVPSSTWKLLEAPLPQNSIVRSK